MTNRRVHVGPRLDPNQVYGVWYPAEGTGSIRRLSPVGKTVRERVRHLCQASAHYMDGGDVGLEVRHQVICMKADRELRLEKAMT